MDWGLAEILRGSRMGTDRLRSACEFVVLSVRAVSPQSSPVVCVMLAQYRRDTLGEGLPSDVVARRS